MRIQVLLSLLVVSCQSTAHEERSRDEAEIRAQIQSYLRAWNDGDADRLALHYREDGDRINGRGRRFPDRAAIRDSYRRLFASKPDGVTRQLVYDRAQIRWIAPGVAVADSDYTVVGVGPDPTQPIAGTCTSVLVKEDGVWLRAAHRNIVPENPYGADPARAPRSSAPRVAPVDADWSPAQREYLAPYEERGMLFNVFKTAAHHPDFARKFDAFALGHVGGSSLTLTPRQRELLILRTAWLCRSEYAWAQHSRAARSIGVTEEELRGILAGPDAPGWTPLEAALLRAADELHRMAFVPDATWEALAAHFDTRQLIDVVATVGTYTTVCMLLNSLGVELDEGLTGFPE